MTASRHHDEGVSVVRKNRCCEIANASADALRRMETVMDKLIVKALTFKNDRKAVTALEYGIIAGVLGLVLITIFTSFGSKLTTLFTNIGNSI